MTLASSAALLLRSTCAKGCPSAGGLWNAAHCEQHAIDGDGTPSTRRAAPSYVSAASPTMGAGASTQRWTKDEVLAVIGVACDDAAFDGAASGGTVDTETLGRCAADPKAVLWRNLQRFKEQHNELAPYGRELRDIEGVALDKSKRQREANGSEVDFESLYVVAQQARDTFGELVDQALRFSEYAEAPAPPRTR